MIQFGYTAQLQAIEGKRVFFMGQLRQRRYLDTFAHMHPGAQDTLRDIYVQAHQPGGIGRHTVTAMVASARHPEILRLTLSNLMLRFLFKQAVQRGDERQSAHLKEVLDDFHVALDEFMGPDARQSHSQNHDQDQAGPESHRPDEATREAMLVEIRRFNEKAKPAVRKAKKYHAGRG